MLQQAFHSIAKKEYENKKNVKKHYFSLNFYLKMRKIGKKQRKTITVPRLYPVSSKRRLAVAAALITMLVGTTIVGAQPTIQWMYHQCIELHEEFVSMKKEGEQKVENTIFQRYEPTYLPKGYQLETKEYDETFQEYTMEFFDHNKTLYITQSFLNKKNEQITSDGESLQEVAFGKFLGYFIPDKEYNSIIISNETYLIVISGNLSKGELVKIGQGLKISD